MTRTPPPAPGLPNFDLPQCTSEEEAAAWFRMRREADAAGITPSYVHPDITMSRFVQDGWHVNEPTQPYVHNWHIDFVAEHLEACVKGQITRLVINIPPGTMKSRLCCVMWPAWVWTFWPSSRWLFSSHNEEFATRDSLYTRKLINSEWYQRRWGQVFSMKGDRNLQTYFQNDQTGFRQSTGVGGGTGARVNFNVTDDPHKILSVESDSERDAVRDWWLGTMSQRGVDIIRSPMVVIMQRLHTKDLTGVLLEMKELGYEHICLPMEFERNHFGYRTTVIGKKDPRRKEGELLFPQRFPAQAVQTMKHTLKGYGYAGQAQQRPFARGGTLFKGDWLEEVDAVPLAAERVRYYDKAATDKDEDPEAAWTVSVLMAKAKVKGLMLRDEKGVEVPVYDYFIEDCTRAQLSFHKREKAIRDQAARDAAKYGEGEVETWVEQEPGGSGKDVAKFTVAHMAGFRIKTDRAGGEGDKVTRFLPFADQAEGGNVKILKTCRNKDVLIEKLEAFPREGKDEADATGGAFRRLALPRPPKHKKKRSRSVSMLG